MTFPLDDEREEGDLGEGLTEAELYFWADKKREQQEPHWRKHPQKLCSKCRNCLCGRKLRGDAGFRCMCDAGRKLVTPYRVRFMSDRERELHQRRLIYCLTHHIYERKGEVCA
jgi:hypothetical protein